MYILDKISNLKSTNTYVQSTLAPHDSSKSISRHMITIRMKKMTKKS